MNIVLKRYSYASTETEGYLTLDPSVGREVAPLEILYTIEQPWVDFNDASPGYPTPAGKPYESCIPEGTYEMQPYTRTNGEVSWLLVCPDVGVYANKGDRNATWERFKCLPHKANFASNVQGCIAVGMRRAILRNPDNGNNYERSVANSAIAMDRLRDILGELSEGHTLEIVQQRGALYGGD